MVKKVGYGSPPTHSQWQKGQSGNPPGRKKGAVNFKTDLMEELGEIIPVTEGGKAKRITKQRALIKALLTKGIKGDVRAASAVIAWMAKTLAAEPDMTAEAEPTSAEQGALDDLLDRRAALLGPKHHEGDDR
jgi:hypothetical protein